MKKIISWVIRKVPRKYLQIVSPLAMKFFSLLNKGNDVECTVCGNTYSKLLPYGRVYTRDNALCPNCMSLERHRLMYLYLKEKTNFFTANLKVLHVAPEHCFIDRFSKMKNLDHITADIESPLAKVKMDLHSIPFPDNTFDVCFCNHVMEHVEDDIKCMSEIHRVLKPGGWAIIQSPIDMGRATTYEDPTITSPEDREKHFLQDDHVRLFGRDYGQRLQKGGFKVLEDDFAAKLPTERAKRYCIQQGEVIYFCSK